MTSRTRRIRKTLLIVVALLGLASLVEPLFFVREAHVLAWTPDAEQPLQWVDQLGAVIVGGWERPEFPESKTGARPLLVIESAPMDRHQRARRRPLLHEKLAKAKLGPLVLRIVDMPEASLAQKALQLSKDTTELPSGSFVVLELSILDLIREARGSWGGYALPRLQVVEEQIQLSWPKSRHATGPFPPGMLRLPYLRWLPAQPVLETRHGSFPSALWPLRRRGVSKEKARYAKLTLALRYWKQLVQAREGKLLVLYLPQPIEADPKRLAAELVALGLDSKQLQSSRAGKRLRDLCHELAIPYEDMTLLIARSARDKSPLYEGLDSPPFQARFTQRAEKLILGRMVGQGLAPLFK